MADSWWLVLAAGAGLLGFANLQTAGNRRTPTPTALLLSFAAGYGAYRHGNWLWDSGDDHRLVVVALTFPLVSLVLGYLFWYRDIIAIVLIWLGASVASFLLATLCELKLNHAAICGFLGGITVLLPWYSWFQRNRARRQRRREERKQQQREQQEADRQQQLEAQQDDLLEALVEELRK